MKIAEAISYHRSLRVLDLSWNSLGSCTNRTVITALANSFANNKVLYHLDLSHNRLDEADCKILATSMKLNHAIVG